MIDAMQASNLAQTRSRRLLALGETVFLATLAGCLTVLAIGLAADLAEPLSRPAFPRLASR
ncbi:hypothetical protein [Methylobacterium marchantiae]|uniref:Uncharacterized protein n=1 Tax=Methylobacterium marchantiae TaxID=600331 RepID=A0ABW3X4N5_9HYPH|nr:hypothetical protein AIGOOFII_0182 [Methylobacterium marchantiae]